MTATQPTTARKTTDKSSKAPARPVTAVLLELTYLLHATKVVGVREATSEPRRSAPSGRRSESAGSPLAG